MACGEAKYEWTAPNRIPLVQPGVNANAAKVFRAHAAPLGLCDNLINALKLLANQQKDGDSKIQSIVTSLHERSRRGVMDGLRSFIKADNHRVTWVICVKAPDRFMCKKPNFSEAFRKAAIREGADEKTMRADKVGTLRAFIDTDHSEFARWRPPLVDAGCLLPSNLQRNWRERVGRAVLSLQRYGQGNRSPTTT